MCCIKHCFLYLIRYAHNELISILDLFCIPEAVFSARTFMFDTNAVVSVTFDINSRFCSIHQFVIIPQHNLDLTWNERGQIWIDSMGNHGVMGVFSECRHSSCSNFNCDYVDIILSIIWDKVNLCPRYAATSFLIQCSMLECNFHCWYIQLGNIFHSAQNMKITIFQHCGCWWPGYRILDQQYPLCWLNIHFMILC